MQKQVYKSGDGTSWAYRKCKCRFRNQEERDAPDITWYGTITHHLSKPYMQPTNSGNRTRSRKLRPGELWQVFLSIYMFQSAMICNDLQEQKKLCKPYNDDRFFLHVLSSCLIAGTLQVQSPSFCVDQTLLQSMCWWSSSAIYEFSAALLQSMYWWCSSAIHVLLQASKRHKRKVGR
jgi:hypothetical protein